LKEGQRVRLTIEQLIDDAEYRAAAMNNLRAAVSEMQFRSSGPLPTRDGF